MRVEIRMIWNVKGMLTFKKIKVILKKIPLLIIRIGKKLSNPNGTL